MTMLLKSGRRTRAITLTLVLAMLAGICPLAAFAQDAYPDVPDTHWAQSFIEKWSAQPYNILIGNDDGEFKPDTELTLAELVVVLSKTIQYSDSIPVEGLPVWADEHIEKAAAAGIIDASAGDTVDLSAAVTREEAVRYMAAAYGIAPVEGETTFIDDAGIDPEYKGYVKAFQQRGYLVGKGSNNFDPKGNYTRAEAMTVLNNTTSDIIEASVEGETYANNLIVRKSGVSVKDTTIGENLIIGQGVGDGDVVLENVTINGTLIVYGSGEHAIVVDGEEAVSSVVVSKTVGEPVRLRGAFGTVTAAERTKLTIVGSVSTLVICDDAEVVLQEATVETLEILGDAVTLFTNQGSTVEGVTAAANNVAVMGQDGSMLPVATLADQTISQPEFRYFLNYFKTNMLMETGIEPGSPDEAEFWGQDMGDGNKIIDYAKMSAIEELENLKVCTAVARGRGIVLDAEDMENINTDLQAQMDSVGGEEALIDLLGTTFGITFSDYSSMYGEFMLQNKLVVEELDSIPISEAEIKEYYDQNAELCTSATVRHILYLFEGDDPDNFRTEEESKALAEAMLKRVEAGEDMKALAEEFSEDTGVTMNSGEYTFKRTDGFVPEFLDWGFASEIGDCGIVETSYGYHVMKKEGIVVEPLEDVTDSINTTIKNGKMDIVFEGWKADPKNVLVLNQEVFDSIE